MNQEAIEAPPPRPPHARRAPIRVLVTKIGLDGHDRGSRVVAAFLRDAGMDVIYTPPWQRIEDVVTIAGQEDVDVIGISTLATDHLIIPDLITALEAAHLGHIAVVVGGIVPDAEADALADAGVQSVFGPGSGRDEIVGAVERLGRRVQSAKFGREIAP
jgi:methylmalonyl-CoA mutase C-terminal domain/subunit